MNASSLERAISEYREVDAACAEIEERVTRLHHRLDRAQRDYKRLLDEAHGLREARRDAERAVLDAARG